MERAARSALEQGLELHHLLHAMVSSRTISSHFLGFNPQTLTQVFSMHEWFMDIGSCSINLRVRSRVATTQSSQFFLSFLSHEDFWNFYKESSNLSFGLETRMLMALSSFLMASNPSNLKLSCHAQS